MNILYTIGHSTHTIERFIELLSIHSITAVCDVRSSPYSRYNPQFNREAFQQELLQHNIAYVFLGNELGPRSSDPSCYEEGRVQYDRLALTDFFREGIERVKKGMNSYRVSLICSEKDPIACHRMILICRSLRAEELEIKHIMEHGNIEENHDSERRLMELLNIPQQTLFDSEDDLINRAYDAQSRKIAYVVKDDIHE